MITYTIQLKDKTEINVSADVICVQPDGSVWFYKRTILDAGSPTRPLEIDDEMLYIFAPNQWISVRKI